MTPTTRALEETLVRVTAMALDAVYGALHGPPRRRQEAPGTCVCGFAAKHHVARGYANACDDYQEGSHE